MPEASSWIKYLGLQPHPEGGFFKEIYRSNDTLPPEALPSDFKDGPRNISTAIYFLLRSQDRSVFHRILSDEIWHFHDGGTLIIHTLHPADGLTSHRLGLNTAAGDMPQVVISAGTWFGAMVEEANDFNLASCTVSPGFDFRDFEMANQELLLEQFPQFAGVIRKLT